MESMIPPAGSNTKIRIVQRSMMYAMIFGGKNPIFSLKKRNPPHWCILVDPLMNLIR